MTVTITEEGNDYVARRDDTGETGRSPDVVKALRQIGLVSVSVHAPYLPSSPPERRQGFRLS